MGVIWQIRNGVVFKGEEVDLVKAVDLIQYRVWMWLKGEREQVLGIDL